MLLPAKLKSVKTLTKEKFKSIYINKYEKFNMNCLKKNLLKKINHKNRR